MAENGPVRPLLRTNVGVQDALLHNPKQSPFAYQAPMTTCNHLVEEITFRPLNQPTRFGSTSVWELSKVADLVGPIQLVLQLAALTQPVDADGANYTSIMYCNNLGIGMIEELRVTYASNPIVVIPPEWLYIRYRKYRGLTSYQAWRTLSRMDQTTAERRAFAANGGEVIVDLAMPFADDTSQYFTMVGMSEKLRIQVRLKTLDHILNYDMKTTGNATPQLCGGQSTDLIQDINLRAECVHLTGAERDTTIANVKSSDGQAKLIEDIQGHYRVYIPVTPAAFTYRLQLTNITNAVRSLFWWLEDPKNTAGSQDGTPWGGDYPLYPVQALNMQWSYYYLTSGANTIIPRTSSLRSRWLNHQRWFSGIHPGEYLNGYSFSVAPETPNASLGSLNFGMADTPQLNIEFPNGLNNDYDPAVSHTQGAYLVVVADTLNFLHEQGGDLMKTFA